MPQKLYTPPILSAKGPIPLRTFLTCAATNVNIKESREAAFREAIDPYCRQIYNAMREYVNQQFEKDDGILRIEVNLYTTVPNKLYFYKYKTGYIPENIESCELDIPDFKGFDNDAMALGHYLIDAYGFQKDSADTLARNICFVATIPLAPLD